MNKEQIDMLIRLIRLVEIMSVPLSMLATFKAFYMFEKLMKVTESDIARAFYSLSLVLWGAALLYGL